MMTEFETIREHLTYINKRGVQTFKNKAYVRSYWEKRDIAHLFDWMHAETAFLPQDTSVSVRYYFIEFGLTSIPLCPVCHQEINIPKSYYDCLPTTHNRCVRSFVDHKIQATLLEKYGGNPMNDAAIKEKHRASQALVDRQAAAAKAVATKKSRNPEYGSAAAGRVDARRRSAQDQALDRTHAQRHIHPEVLSKINCRDWLVEQYQTKPANQIAAEMGVNKTIIQNRIHKFDIPVIKRYSSLPEGEIADFLQSVGVNNIQRNVGLDGFELDLYLPDKKIAIEYHGLYWHVEGNQPRKNIHLQKYLTCERHGIRLFQIWSNEWEDRRQVVESKLKHACGVTGDRIFARKCKVVDISPKEARDFCDANHIQGYVNSSYRIGLRYGTQLVAMMSFGKGRYNKEYQWELLRACSVGSVVGGMSKLWRHFIREQSPDSVISYSNNRYGTGGMYHTLEFTHVSNGQPNYYYVNLRHTDRVYHRSAFQKHKLNSMSGYSPEKTEYEIMLDSGFDRIWDAGSQVYGWKSNTGAEQHP